MPTFRRVVCLRVVPVLAMILVCEARADTIHVPDDQPTIQAGIDAASAADTVLVSNGTYSEHDIVMKSGIILRSSGGEAELVIIDARQEGRVLCCDGVGPTTRIEGITFSGGFADQGGGILCANSSPAIRDCVLRDNSADDVGGGMYCEMGSSPSLENCAFVNNTAADTGAGIACFESALLCNLSTFQGNVATNAGGATAAWASSTLFEACHFIENTAPLGAALFCALGAMPSLVRCTLAANSGSGVELFSFAGVGCDASFENTIIAFSKDGPAISCSSASSASLVCCDLFGNEGGDWISCIADQSDVDGNFSADPLFCGAGDWSLADDSPCLAGQHPTGHMCGSIGASGLGCGNSAVEATTWGAFKARFRGR